MDFPYSPAHAPCAPRAGGALAVWLMVAMIGVILGAAAIAAAFTTDTRDFAARHGTVLKTRAL